MALRMHCALPGLFCNQEIHSSNCFRLNKAESV